MTKDPIVDLVFSHSLPRYVAIGVDRNDAQRLITRIERWEDRCSLWSEEAARHEALAKEASDKDRRPPRPKPMCGPQSTTIAGSTYLRLMRTSGWKPRTASCGADARLARCGERRVEGTETLSHHPDPASVEIVTAFEHVVSYKFHPLTADWMAERLGTRQTLDEPAMRHAT